MRAHAVLVLVAFLAPAFAGCLEETPEAQATEAPGDAVEVRPGVIIGSNLGGIVGEVRNDAGFRLPKVHVSLLETNHFTNTVKDGAYQFLNLTPGTYKMYAQAEAYQPYEADVAVTAGNLTEHTIHMLPKESVGAGLRDHVHDFWLGRSEVELMSAQVDLSDPRRQDGRIYSRYYNAIYEPNSNGTEAGWWQFAIAANGQGDPSIIFPGTKEVVVTFTWTQQQVTLSKLGLAYGRPQDSPPHVPKFWLPLKSTGQSWTIPLAPEDADTGHQSFSFWRFYVYSGNSLSGSATTWQPGLILGPVHIKIVIKKGEVLPEPAHEDFWGERDSIQITLKQFDRTQVFGERAIPGQYAFQIPSGTLIPPGTARMRLHFQYAYCDQYTSCGTNGSAADRNIVLTWRSADMHPFDTPYSAYHRMKPTDDRKHTKIYEFDVAAKQTDAFYQKRTNWLFMPSAEGEENQDYYLEGRGVRLNLVITLFRDPNFTRD